MPRAQCKAEAETSSRPLLERHQPARSSNLQ